MTTYSEEQISAIKQEAKESLLENLSGIMTRKDTSTSHASRKPPIFKYGAKILIHIWKVGLILPGR